MFRLTTLLALTLSLATAFAQTPAPVSFLWPTPVSFPVTEQQSYDMHANELGINVV